MSSASNDQLAASSLPGLAEQQPVDTKLAQHRVEPAAVLDQHLDDSVLNLSQELDFREGTPEITITESEEPSIEDQFMQQQDLPKQAAASTPDEGTAMDSCTYSKPAEHAQVNQTDLELAAFDIDSQLPAAHATVEHKDPDAQFLTGAEPISEQLMANQVASDVQVTPSGSIDSIACEAAAPHVSNLIDAGMFDNQTWSSHVDQQPGIEQQAKIEALEIPQTNSGHADEHSSVIICGFFDGSPVIERFSAPGDDHAPQEAHGDLDHGNSAAQPENAASGVKIECDIVDLAGDEVVQCRIISHDTIDKEPAGMVVSPVESTAHVDVPLPVEQIVPPAPQEFPGTSIDVHEVAHEPQVPTDAVHDVEKLEAQTAPARSVAPEPESCREFESDGQPNKQDTASSIESKHEPAESRANIKEHVDQIVNKHEPINVMQVVEHEQGSTASESKSHAHCLEPVSLSAENELIETSHQVHAGAHVTRQNITDHHIEKSDLCQGSKAESGTALPEVEKIDKVPFTGHPTEHESVGTPERAVHCSPKAPSTAEHAQANKQKAKQTKPDKPEQVEKRKSIATAPKANPPPQEKNVAMKAKPVATKSKAQPTAKTSGCDAQNRRTQSHSPSRVDVVARPSAEARQKTSDEFAQRKKHREEALALNKKAAGADQTDKQQRKKDAEAAFQNWLQRKELERRRARSTGRPLQANSTAQAERRKQPSSGEKEAVFHNWLNRKSDADGRKVNSTQNGHAQMSHIAVAGATEHL